MYLHLAARETAVAERLEKQVPVQANVRDAAQTGPEGSLGPRRSDRVCGTSQGCLAQGRGALPLAPRERCFRWALTGSALFCRDIRAVQWGWNTASETPKYHGREMNAQGQANERQKFFQPSQATARIW